MRLLGMAIRTRTSWLHRCLYLLGIAWQKYQHCSKGEHLYLCLLTGEMANYCEACGTQLNPLALKRYRVALRGGEHQVVSAVNEVHARNMVIYAGDNTPTRTAKVQSKNIVNVELLIEQRRKRV